MGTRLVRLSDDGQVPLPDDIRERLALHGGDIVAMVDTSDGVRIARQVAEADAPRGQIVHQLPAYVGEALDEPADGELALRQAAVDRALRARVDRPIAPLTSVDLVQQARSQRSNVE